MCAHGGCIAHVLVGQWKKAKSYVWVIPWVIGVFFHSYPQLFTTCRGGNGTETNMCVGALRVWLFAYFWRGGNPAVQRGILLRYDAGVFHELYI